MKKDKKISLFLFAIILSFALLSCSKDDEEHNSVEDIAKVGYSLCLEEITNGFTSLKLDYQYDVTRSECFYLVDNGCYYYYITYTITDNQPYNRTIEAYFVYDLKTNDVYSISYSGYENKKTERYLYGGKEITLE